MAGKKVDRKKAAIVGTVWSFAYFTFILYYVSNDLGFNLLSPHDWESTYIAFMAGQFSIEPDKLILLLLTLILLVPVWLIGWKAFYSVNWKMPRFLLRHKEIQFKRELIITPNKGKLQAPVKLRLQSSNPYSGLKKEAFGDLPELPVTSHDAHNVVSVVEKTTATDNVQDIIAYVDRYNVDTFKDVVLDGAKVPLAISTDDKAILITLLDIPDATWIIDVSDEESEWYCETSHIPSPTAFIKKAADALKALEPDSLVIPAVVITDGEIYDAPDIAKHYEAMGIQILRFKNGAPATLQTLESFIDTNFVAKSDEPSAQAADTPAMQPTDDTLIPPSSLDDENINEQEYFETGDETFDDTVYENDSFEDAALEGDTIASNSFEDIPDESNSDEGDFYAENIRMDDTNKNMLPDGETFDTTEPNAAQQDIYEGEYKDFFSDESLQDEDNDTFVLTKDLQLPQDNEYAQKTVKDDKDETN